MSKWVSSEYTISSVDRATKTITISTTSNQYMLYTPVQVGPEHGFFYGMTPSQRVHYDIKEWLLAREVKTEPHYKASAIEKAYTNNSKGWKKNFV